MTALRISQKQGEFTEPNSPRRTPNPWEGRPETTLASSYAQVGLPAHGRFQNVAITNLVHLLLAVALVAVFPGNAAGAVSLFQSVHSGSVSSGTDTVTCTLAPTGSSHNIIVAAVAFGRGATTPTVASVIDDRGNSYSPVPNGRGTHAYQDVEVWHAIGATAGVTQVTVTLGGVGYKECYVFEVSGTLTYDTSAGVNDGFCKLAICPGAPVVTATTAGFVVGVIAADPIARSPADGNEFTGGMIGLYGNSAAAILLSDTPKSHQPVWESSGPTADMSYASVTVAYKQ